MKYLNLTLPTPEENLACDEVLLDACEGGNCDEEVLRFWEPSQHFVVLGYSNKVDLEVNQAACRIHKIPIYRRCSGGGTVLQGPGCLNYTLILDIRKRKSIRNLVNTNTFVLTKHQQALEPVIKQEIKIEGTSDLAVSGMKFSGNAQRRKKHFLLFHGTFLHDFDIARIEKFLRFPRKQPDYRKNRLHIDFLINLNTDANTIKKILKESWHADGVFTKIPLEKIRQLAKTIYATDEWNLKF